MAATQGERGTEENLRAALGATVSVIDEVKAVNKALADALRFVLAALDQDDQNAVFRSGTSIGQITARIDAALRLAGRLP